MREVYIRHENGNYIVCYVLRRKGGRYLAAQFNDVDNDLEKVINWVEKNPKLKLKL